MENKKSGAKKSTTKKSTTKKSTTKKTVSKVSKANENKDIKNSSNKINLNTIKNKNIIIIVIAALLLIILSSVLFLKSLNSNKKPIKNSKIEANTNTNIVKDEKVDALKFTDVTLVRDKKTKQYTLSMSVVNTSKEAFKEKIVDIIFKDKDGNEIISLVGYLGENGLEPNQETTITSSVSDAINLNDATNKEIKIRK